MAKDNARATWEVNASLGLDTDAINISTFGFIGSLNSSEIGTGINLAESRTRVQFLTVASAHQIRSSSASDTSAGTGARAILVVGLDTNWDTVAMVAVMNGTTPVALPTNILAVNTVAVISTGSLNTNAGDITVERVTGAVLQGFIAAGVSLNRSGKYTTPRNTKFLAYNVYLNGNRSGAATDTVTIDFNLINSTGLVTKVLTNVISNGAPLALTLPCPLAVSEKTRGELVITNITANNFNVSCGFTGILYSL